MIILSSVGLWFAAGGAVATQILIKNHRPRSLHEREQTSDLIDRPLVGPSITNSPWFHSEDYSKPPVGAKIALAYRGAYRRDLKGRCKSDWWWNKDNIEENLVKPLQSAGAEVRKYFHTWADNACTLNNHDLVRDLKPDNYQVDDYDEINLFSKSKWKHDQSYSILTSLQMASVWADYTIIVRFDVRYYVPITSLNVNWSMLNIAGTGALGSLPRMNDLLFIVPKKHVSSFNDALNKTYIDMDMQFVEEIGEEISPPMQNRLQDIYERVDREQVNFIDPKPRRSASFDSFLYIDRHCTDESAKCLGHN